MESLDKYLQAATIARQIEEELKFLNRWSDHSLPEEKFENMGVFGCNTMNFEQWIQFVLLPRLNEIIATKKSFPASSNLAVYAVRAFDGDEQTDQLQNLLRQLDDLAEGSAPSVFETEETFLPNDANEIVSLNSTEIPPTLLTVIDLLPKFTGEDLESQLQTIDIFVKVLHSSVRPTISSLMKDSVKEKEMDSAAKKRILNAALAVALGKSAAQPYNHEEAMRKYREEHLKSFPESFYDAEKKD